MKLPTHVVAAGGIVTDPAGKLLLVKHHKHGWVFPGGIIENGESVTDGLAREIAEETGVTTAVQTLFCVSTNVASYPGYNGVDVIPTKLMLDFICAYAGGEPAPSEENAESGWFSPKECRTLVTDPAHRVRLDAYFAFDGTVRYHVYSSVRDKDTGEAVFRMIEERAL
ncbi:MAG: NUDIX domain-containing protein [Oscillospiraceae bacterium]